MSNPILQEIKAQLGRQASRKGLCNSPHPDPKYLEPAMVPHPEGKTYRDPSGRTQLVYVESMAPSVMCSKFAGHELRGDMMCSAFAFSISTPDEWPHPVNEHPDAPPF